MKKIFLFLLTSLISVSSFAQKLPQGIAYQAVAVKESPYSVAGENPQAIYWSNKDIKVQFTILDQYPNPTDTYQEFHSITTDDYGVFNLIIGQGTVISGNFETIPWELGTAHLQVEIDFENDDNYTVTSFERFWSVPYAFVSKKDKSTNNDSAIQSLNDKITYLKNRDQDTVLGNEIQLLSINNDTISLSNGGGKVALVSAWFTDGDTTSTFNQVGIGSKSTYPGVELILKDEVFASQLIETTGPTTDAELWLKNPTGTWRMHGDQSDANKLKFGLWSDYSETGGTNILPETLTIDTLGRIGVGRGVNFKEAFNVRHNDSAFVQIEAGGNNKAGIVIGELDGARGGRIIVDGDNTNNLIFQVTDDKGQSSGQIPEYVDVMHMPYFPGSQVGNVGIGTASPTASLHINSSSSKTGLLIENTDLASSAKIVLNQVGSPNGQAYYLVSRGDGDFVIGNASNGIADQFVINSFGNVGIGTKNPTHSLEVVGSGIGGSQALKLKRNRNIPTYGVRLDFNLLNSKNEDIKYGHIIGSIADSTAGAEKGFLSLGVANGSGTWSDGYTEERLRIETDRVTVKNIMRLKPLSAAPASPLEGDVYMNSVTHKLMVYDGTTWQACW
tara:strand:+ start:1395 stop:3239 length:1845 start_codon:yes stop_codon:yes gene_type:complete